MAKWPTAPAWAAVAHRHDAHADLARLAYRELHGAAADDDAQPAVGVHGGRARKLAHDLDVRRRVEAALPVLLLT